MSYYQGSNPGDMEYVPDEDEEASEVMSDTSFEQWKESANYQRVTIPFSPTEDFRRAVLKIERNAFKAGQRASLTPQTAPGSDEEAFAKSTWEQWNMTGPDSAQWEDLYDSERNRWRQVIAATRQAASPDVKRPAQTAVGEGELPIYSLDQAMHDRKIEHYKKALDRPMILVRAAALQEMVKLKREEQLLEAIAQRDEANRKLGISIGRQESFKKRAQKAEAALDVPKPGEIERLHAIWWNDARPLSYVTDGELTLAAWKACAARLRSLPSEPQSETRKAIENGR